ncbi:hypothetical protein JSY36_13285 [Bacillus sp. H-16]|nr:hypothetical protein [Alteribacter salitolerans]MBM7096714.1 hypothetical protein [Alteribacter salitolerans]
MIKQQVASTQVAALASWKRKKQVCTRRLDASPRKGSVFRSTQLSFNEGL